MELRQECSTCWSDIDLNFHTCNAVLCKACLKPDHICDVCKQKWEILYEPIHLQNHINRFISCGSHDRFNPNKIPSQFCPSCFKNPKILEDFFKAIPTLTNLPEFLKVIHKAISNSKKVQKVEFIKFMLGSLGACCVKCQKTLGDLEKSRKACADCWEIVESSVHACKNELEDDYYSWVFDDDDDGQEPSDLFVKTEALRYFSNKIKYVPAFKCLECRNLFDSEAFVPMKCESLNKSYYKSKILCFKCSLGLDSNYNVYRFESDRMCVNNCGSAGECLLTCKHSVCFRCCTGNFYQCCGTVSDIVECKKADENYFYLCDKHQVSSDIFSFKTGEFYCKYCTEDELDCIKVSENFSLFSNFLLGIYRSSNPAKTSEFIKKISSEKYLICKPILAEKTKFYFFEKIIPEDSETLSQSFVLTNSDYFNFYVTAKESIWITGVYITGTLKNSKLHAYLEIIMDDETKFVVNFQILTKKLQLIKIDPLELRPDSVCKFYLTFQTIEKVFCYSGKGEKSSSILDLHSKDLGIFYGLKHYLL